MVEQWAEKAEKGFHYTFLCYFVWVHQVRGYRVRKTHLLAAVKISGQH